MKKAYVVAEIQVNDAIGYADYLPLSTASLAQYGGTFLVRGGQRDQKEGGDEAHGAGWRTVITEFVSIDAAQRWYDSVEYQKAKSVRVANSLGRLFIVEGV